MRRAYLFVGRLVSPVAIIGLKIVTRLTGRPRVRVLVTDEHGHILLIQGVLSDGRWTLPGGGVGRREALVAAARRELHEETGILASKPALRFIGTLTRAEAAISFDAPLFRTRVKHTDLPAELSNPKEIAAAGWFAPDALPRSLSKIAAIVLKDLA